MSKKLIYICLAALIFKIQAGDWSELGSPTSMTGQNNMDLAGYSVSINAEGNIVAVGEDGWPAGYSKGRVRVYQYTGGDWAELGSPTAMTGQNTSDQAGYSVSINTEGNIVAFGEPYWNAPAGSYNGRVRVYQYTGGDWTELGSPTAMAGQNAGDFAGSSVAINAEGNIVAVGEPYWGDHGRVRVYQYTGGDWTGLGSPNAMTGQNNSDQAGSSVSINDDGTIVAVGEYGWSGGYSNARGRVRVYQYTGGDWAELGSPTAMTGQNGGDRAGQAVSINAKGSIVAVGEDGWPAGSYNGRVRVYQYTGGDWSELGSPNAMTGQNHSGYAGRSVSINAEGSIVAVGEDRWSAGSNNGRVRVYQYTGGDWTELGSPTAMTGQNNNDQAGWSVSINAEGTIVAVGEYGWDIFSSGRVRVYQFSINFEDAFQRFLRSQGLTNSSSLTNSVGGKYYYVFRPFDPSAPQSMLSEIQNSYTGTTPA